MTLEMKDIAEAMKDIDICMMTTKTGADTLESRPMSNNRNVEYNGDSFFFADGNCAAAREIEADPEVNLAYVHEPSFGNNLYISISGRAALIRDRAIMEEYWDEDVEKWFKEGLDTPGLTLIHVKATRIKYWDGYEEGEVVLPKAAPLKASA